ncbi:MAG: hypothetical protein HY906_05815, partial [Deltaproteobacteria bacterium]|nr:hypothetical protein [Deltaproteobacteria bacterium]
MPSASPQNRNGSAPAGGSAARPPGRPMAAPDATNPTRPPQCETHPAAVAAWRCPRHGDLCPDCAAERRAGVTSLVVCVHCGALAPPITVPRESLSFAARLPAALAYPLSRHGFLAMAGLGLVMAFMPRFTILGVIFSLGIYWSYMFALIEQSANGSAEIETPDFTSVWDDIFAPAVRGVAATGIIWVPAVLIAVFGISADAPLGVMWVPIVLVVLVGLFYAPMAIMVAATRNPFLRVVNPYFVTVCVGRLGADYAAAVGAIVALGAVQVPVKLLGSVVDSLPIPILSTWLASTIGLYVPFVMARVLGLLLYVRGVDLGYGLASDYDEPVLPDAKPRGAARPGPDVGFGPVAADPGVAAAGAPADLPPGVLAPPPRATPDEVAAALARGDRPAAVELWERLDPEDHHALPPGSHVAVGRAAAAAKDFHLAVRALRAAADVAPDDPGALRA